MITVVRPWYEAKLFVEHAIRIEHGTLHVVVGFFAWIVIAFIWRKPLSSWKPWLGALILIGWNEAIDLGVERWPNLGMQLGEAAADLALTMLVPTCMMLIARCAPEALGMSVRASSSPRNEVSEGDRHCAQKTGGASPTRRPVKGGEHEA